MQRQTNMLPLHPLPRKFFHDFHPAKLFFTILAEIYALYDSDRSSSCRPHTFACRPRTFACRLCEAQKMFLKSCIFQDFGKNTTLPIFFFVQW